jgi:hypothetical protein
MTLFKIFGYFYVSQIVMQGIVLEINNLGFLIESILLKFLLFPVMVMTANLMC